MADTIEGKATKAVRKVALEATAVGNKIAEGLREGRTWMKDTALEVGPRVKESMATFEQKAQITLDDGSDISSRIASIREHMEVVGSCGNRLGRVDHVEGETIKLTRNGSSDGLHHFIPVSWVDHVDDKAHLNKTRFRAKQEWQSE